MASQWNRKKRRAMNRCGIAQKALEEQYDKVCSSTRDDAYNTAFSAMLLAIHQLHGFGHKRIRQIAVQTIHNINESLCATELIEQLKRETGFDVLEPLGEDKAGMEVE